MLQASGWEWLPEQPWFYDNNELNNELDAVRVLLAEDDDDLRELLAESLRGQGYLVMEAADGEQLIEFLAARLLGLEEPGATAVRSRHGRPNELGCGVDLIVSDIMMPGPNGLWALATLRHMDWATPFVVITALDDEQARRQAEKLGAAAFLRKPLELERFLGTVSNLTGPASPELLEPRRERASEAARAGKARREVFRGAARMARRRGTSEQMEPRR